MEKSNTADLSTKQVVGVACIRANWWQASSITSIGAGLEATIQSSPVHCFRVKIQCTKCFCKGAELSVEGV